MAFFMSALGPLDYYYSSPTGLEKVVRNQHRTAVDR